MENVDDSYNENISTLNRLLLWWYRQYILGLITKFSHGRMFCDTVRTIIDLLYTYASHVLVSLTFYFQPLLSMVNGAFKWDQ